MNVLITGGAGYIGSHAVLTFHEAGYGIVVVDDLSTGRREAIPADIRFVQGNAGDIQLIRRTIQENDVRAVIHFAGSIVVPESVEFPLKYYLNNTSASRNLIQACIDTGVDRFIYSSTAAVYGPPKDLPVAEDAPTIPLNPYGRSKLMTEWILQDAGAAYGLRYLCLRYFNVAGADPLGRAGQLNPNATHLIKVASQAVVGLRDGIEVFGEDYETPDGTCIRDYIHVTDLATAHVNALRYLEAGGQSQILNCGYGRGYSIKQVLRTVEEMSGLKLKICSGPRRPGDVPALVADSRKIRDTLAWRPTYDNLATIVETAIRWERSLTSAPKDNEGAQ